MDRDSVEKASALLTIMHETLLDGTAGRETAVNSRMIEIALGMDGDDDTVDWRSIALSLGMIGHLMLECVPTAFYEAMESALSDVISQKMGLDTQDVRVAFTERMSGTVLLQQISLQLAAMSVALDETTAEDE